jgi:YlmC/YmxH family sporulation protein
MYIKGDDLMSENIKALSEIEKYEIININDGEKYSCLSNNDLVIDDNGNLKLIVLNCNQSRFSFFGGNEYMEIPWEHVKKIGLRTIIIDVENSAIKKTRL